MSPAKQQWYLEKKADRPDGVCSAYPDCVRLTDGTHRLCSHHLQTSRERKKTFRAKLKTPGQCGASDCKNAALPGLSRCARCSMRELAWAKRPSSREKFSQARQRLKQAVFDGYGSVCACCGEAEIAFLSLDHVDGYAGVGPRRGDHLYQWVKTKGYPPGFRVLCLNCNCALGHHGYCPHSTLQQKVKPKRTGVLVSTPQAQAYQREYRRKFRQQVFQAYGGARCACCGESHLECLTIDHLHGDGAQHRKNDPSAAGIYKWLVKRGFPSGFQVLCLNCNFAKGVQGQCPHKNRPEPEVVP